MRICSEALPFVFPPALVATGAAAVGSTGAAVFLGGLALAIAAFFRDPDRFSGADPDAIVSPADGRVLAVDEEPDGLRITIFLSVFNVHVTRAPVDGALEGCERRAGSYAVAFRDTARDNAHVLMQIRNGNSTVELALMAGAVARRIVTWVSVPCTLRRGQRLGIIRFGSRAELTLPAGSVAEAAPGDSVRAGETVLARLAPPAPARTDR